MINAGNIKNEYFHYEIMKDIEGFVKTLLMLVGIDAICLIISSTFLYFTCKMNMLQVRKHKNIGQYVQDTIETGWS